MPNTNISWINMGEPYWKIDHSVVEERYKATYVGDLCIALSNNNGWSDQPVAVFWQKDPPPNMSNYFGLFFTAEKQAMITGAASVAEGIWRGVVGNDGEIVFSRWRHDCRFTCDGTGMADGGRDYFRGYGTSVSLRVQDGRMVIVDEKDEIEKEEPPSAE